MTLLSIGLLLVACGGGPGTPVPVDPGDVPPGDPGPGESDPKDPADPVAPDWATGVITAEVDGKSVTVYTLLTDDHAGGQDSTATWQDQLVVDHVRVDLTGHPTRNVLDYNGAITVEVALDAALSQKPIMDEGNKPFKVVYWESLTRSYLMQEGSVEVDEAVFIDEDTIHIKGTFAGTFEAGFAGAEGSMLVTNGTFDVWQVIRE